MELDDGELDMVRHLRKQSRENHRKSSLNKTIPGKADTSDLLLKILEESSNHAPSDIMCALTEALYQVYELNYLDVCQLDEKVEEELLSEVIGAIVRHFQRNFLSRKNKLSTVSVDN